MKKLDFNDTTLESTLAYSTLSMLQKDLNFKEGNTPKYKVTLKKYIEYEKAKEAEIAALPQGQRFNEENWTQNYLNTTSQTENIKKEELEKIIFIGKNQFIGLIQGLNSYNLTKAASELEKITWYTSKKSKKEIATKARDIMKEYSPEKLLNKLTHSADLEKELDKLVGKKSTVSKIVDELSTPVRKMIERYNPKYVSLELHKNDIKYFKNMKDEKIQEYAKILIQSYGAEKSNLNKIFESILNKRWAQNNDVKPVIDEIKAVLHL